MNEAIELLYSTFSHYRVGSDFVGCPCCVKPEHSIRLASLPLREITFRDMKGYAFKAISTWGTVHHFKHFLPRLFELTIEHRDGFLDLAVVFGKLSHAQFDSWPSRERAAVDRFLDAYWHMHLNSTVYSAFDDVIDTVLCAIGCGLTSVQRFLDAWLAVRTPNAQRHLAAFILINEAGLLKSGKLNNAFWDRTCQPYREVIDWLKSPQVLEYLQAAEPGVLTDDFEYALPQLRAFMEC